MTEADPVVGNWYQALDRDHKFKVVAIDESGRTVDVQSFDGGLEEIDLDDWYELQLEPIEPPEDWTGPVDGIERDDLGYSETGMEPQREAAARRRRE